MVCFVWNAECGMWIGFMVCGMWLVVCRVYRVLRAVRLLAQGGCSLPYPFAAHVHLVAWNGPRVCLARRPAPPAACGKLSNRKAHAAYQGTLRASIESTTISVDVKDD